MNTTLFLTLLTIISSVYLLWGFRALPKEHWQIMAALPITRLEAGPWRGVNLTWYGFLSANAYVAAVAIFLLLSGALDLPLPPLALFTVALLGLCIPAASLVARIVEKKAHTLTVGGAVFVGLVASPAVLMGANRAAAEFAIAPLPPLPVLAALSVAYAFGEGLGRLACISFGCCYGKPIHESPEWLRIILERFAVRFFGTTKKIAYAGNLEGERVLPVQAMTAVLYVATGLLGCRLFLAGEYLLVFVATVTVTQLWRVVSEFLRADCRGTGRLTVYQWMGLAAVPYALSVTMILPAEAIAMPVIDVGFAALWSPGMLLGLQGLWLLIFFLTGCSSVTGSTLDFHVHHERI